MVRKRNKKLVTGVGNRHPPYKKAKSDIAVHLLYALAGACLMSLAAFVFSHQKLVLLAAACFGAVVGPGEFRRSRQKKEKQLLRTEMKEVLDDLLILLRSGRSLESALLSCFLEMDPKEKKYSYPLFEEMAAGLKLSYSAEEVLAKMAEKSGIEEIRSLSKTIEICKRTEGDTAKVMEQTVRYLKDRMEIQAEIKILLAKKQMEQKIMGIMPFGMIFLLLLLSPSYLSPLYRTITGQIVMVCAAALMALSIWLSRKIIQIDL